MINTTGQVLSNEKVGQTVFKLVIKLQVMPSVNPGQFVMVSPNCIDGMTLKRPISINSYNYELKTITLIFEVLGKGTDAISKFKPGESINILMPCGNSFELEGYKNIAVVGGGLGVIPLCSVLENFKDKNFYSYLGFRNKDKVLCMDVYESKSKFVKVTTDDGSLGEKDFITNVLKRDLQELKIDCVVACGPKPMLASLKKVVGDVVTFVSMEERMGCGFGACLVCTCKTTTGNVRVCADGPIFNIKELIL